MRIVNTSSYFVSWAVILLCAANAQLQLLCRGSALSEPLLGAHLYGRAEPECLEAGARHFPTQEKTVQASGQLDKPGVRN
jgi:hypothetical protein